MWWDPYTSGWKQWNGGTCTNVAAAQDGSAYITNDCGTVYHSGGWAGEEDGMHASRGGGRLAAMQHVWCGVPFGQHTADMLVSFLLRLPPIIQVPAPGPPCLMQAQRWTLRLA